MGNENPARAADEDRRIYDLLIIGGGINGVGVARDAAGRGYSVLLAERHDLGSQTSSATTKLVHGGLRYLEHGHFSLVREALAERERLMAIAPHLVRPLQFILPHVPGIRSAWSIRLGLWLYDRLAHGQSLPSSEVIPLHSLAPGWSLCPDYQRGFSYWDCRVDDSRLVVLNALDAAEHGAEIRVRQGVAAAESDGAAWAVTLDGGEKIRARLIVNAAGPWVSRVLASLGRQSRRHLRLVKGSHIVVRRCYEGEQALVLQNSDRRIVFIIPYESEFSLIGTTEISFAGDPLKAAITEEEIHYLCNSVNQYLDWPIAPDEVVHQFSGVRPLWDDYSASNSAVTREDALEMDPMTGQPGVLTIFGGKLTDYRRRAERVMAKIMPLLPLRRGQSAGWSAQQPLPGGEIANMENFVAQAARQHPYLAPQQARRMAYAYGTRMARFVSADMGEELGDGLTEAELAYLVKCEWARSVEDVLWRRSKLGLYASPETARRIANCLRQYMPDDLPS